MSAASRSNSIRSEGNWDLVGNNIPVFFIQDAIKFPDLIHAVKMEADRGYPQAGSAHDTFWDWASLMPETTHMLMWAMSDRTLPRSLRMMEGFGVHTFLLVNEAGETHFVKFHWKPKLGLQSTIWDEALKLQAADNDYHRRDLFEAIDTGNFPNGSLAFSCSTKVFADAQPYDVLDATKLIPKRTCRCASSGGWCSTAMSTISSPRPSRSLSARAISCLASISRTIHCCKAGSSPISTRRSRGSAPLTSTRSRSMRRAARSRISSATGKCR
jgi:hypothetical protein